MIKTFEEYRLSVTGTFYTVEMFNDDNKNGKLTNEYNKYVSAAAADIKKEFDKKIEKFSFLENAVNALGEEKVLECYKNCMSNKSAYEKGVYNPSVKSEIEYQLSLIK